MEALLFLAIVILAVVLMDTRARLKLLERRAADRDSAGPALVRVPRPSVSSKAMEKGPDTGEAMPSLLAAQTQSIEPMARAVEAEAEAAAAIPAPSTIPMPVAASSPSASIAADAIDPTQSPETPEPADPLPPIPERVPKKARGAGRRFEDLFGRQLPIWAGGITLAVAGVLLVKYSIDAGLLSPMVRVLIGLIFGAGLIAGAEAALRQDARVRDPRVRQALSGAGIATLYAAILAAANLYDLVGPATAFVGLALVTGLAMLLSVRFGAPSAILGLVGGLAAPALVGEGPPDVPLLSAYLALAIGGLTTLSRRQKWMWLGVGALVGGAGWGGLLILTGALDVATSLSLGLLLLALGVALPMVAFTGARAVALRMAAAVVAAAQIAALVARGGFSPLVWAFYLLLSAALCWLAWREERLRPLPPVGLTIGLLLAALWPEPPVGHYALVLIGLGAIHALPALARLWRTGGSMIEAGQVMAVAMIGYAVTWLHYQIPGGGRDGALALLALAAAGLPALATGMGWRREDRRGDARFAGLVLASALLIAVAALIGMPHWLLPVAVGALAAGLMLLGRVAQDRRVEHGAVAFLGGALLALLSTDPGFGQLGRLGGGAGAVPTGHALLRWGALVLAAGLVACRLTVRGRSAVTVIAAILAYGMAAQAAPVWSLPILASLGLLAMTQAGRRSTGWPTGAAGAGFAGVALLWALEPLAQWLGSALLSLVGEPMLVGDVPVPVDAVTRLAIPAAAGLFALWRGGALAKVAVRRAMIALLSVLAVAATHSLYKQLFHIADGAALVRLGLAERTLWEVLLLGAGWAIWRWRDRPLAALAGAGAAVAHGLWYSQIMLGPLVGPVAVGAWPVANLLLPAFAVLFAGIGVIERTVPFGQVIAGRLIGVARMILIVLFAYASLRQLFCGRLLAGTPVGGVESICVSVLAIGLAVGFLLWGIGSGRHDWRIGSLLLMLAAVAKVFLMDAAGLEGLLRIASFLALGFSLIGIGWLYSRFLRTGDGEVQA